MAVTGGAGFLGSHLVERLASAGVQVVVIDNLSTGRREFLRGALTTGRVQFVEGDIQDTELLVHAFDDVGVVFHLAANADVRAGADDPTRDLEQNTLGTSHVLEAMRQACVMRIVFTSSAAVYGEPSVFPTPEDCPFPLQTSFYGASKLAAEALIEAHCAAFGVNGVIFRLVSMLGERYTHGHVVDFVRQLKRSPSRLIALGDGEQEKSYVYVGDVVDALLLDAHVAPGAAVYNVGLEDTLRVRESISLITDELGVSPSVEFVGGKRGWIGDSPRILPDVSRLRALGWRPRVTLADALRTTVRWVAGDAP